jgi:hypothetical protein
MNSLIDWIMPCLAILVFGGIFFMGSFVAWLVFHSSRLPQQPANQAPENAPGGEDPSDVVQATKSKTPDGC